MREYLNQFKQVSFDKEGEIVGKMEGCKHILEVGYYAGQLSIRLAELAVNLTCVDLPNKIFSPDLNDHIKHNNISNIKHEIVEDVIQYVKDNHSEYDGIYIDESHSEINSLISWLESNVTKPTTVVYNDHLTDSIKTIQMVISERAAAQQRAAAPETAKVTKTAATKKRTYKQNKTTTN